MANIVQRITLAGAAEIRAQLAAIGVAGNAAFDKLGNVQNLSTNFKNFTGALADAGQKFGVFGNNAGEAGKAAIAFGGSVGSALARVTGLSAGLGVAAAKLVGAFKSVGADAEELQQNADAANLTTTAYHNLTLALGQNGVGSEEAGKALDKVGKFIKAASDQTDDYNKKIKALNKQQFEGKLTWQEYAKQLQDIKDGMGDAAQIAQRYNVRLKEQDGSLRNVRDFSIGLGQGMKEASDKTQAAADSLAVFGKSGRKISQAFQQGREELTRLEITAGGLAPVLQAAAQKAAQAMDDAFDQFGQTTKSLKESILAVFAPDVTRILTAFTQLIADNRSRFIALAETVRAEVTPLIENLLKTLSDPKSGEVIVAVFRGAIDGAKAFGVAIRDFIIPTFKAILDTADLVAAKLNKTFGTELTGGVLLAGVVLAKFTGLLRVFTTGITLTVAVIKTFVTAWPAIFAILRAVAIALLTPQAAIIALGIAVGVLVGIFLQNFPRIRDAIITAFTDPVKFINGVFVGLGVIAKAFVDGLIIIFQGIGSFFVTLWQGVVDVAAAAWAGITAGATAIVAGLIAVWQAFLAPWVALWTLVTDGAVLAWQMVRDGATALFNYVLSAAAAPFAAITNAAKSMWTSVAGFFDDLIKRAKEFLGLQAQTGGGGGNAGDGAQSNAAGGHIRGRGTGTSDSILSWLSNGEFVVKAKAVQHYGPQLLHALNNMRLPRFAEGGAVDMAQAFALPSIPRFATGGPSPGGGSGGGMRPMVLQIGDQKFTGLSATSNAVDSLSRFASGKAVRSAGRKPLWFKG